MLKKFQNKYLLAILSGSLCALAFAPFHFFIAAIISLSSFYFLLEKKSLSQKQSFAIGFCYGFGYFLAGIYWISISLLVDAEKFGWLIPFALTLIPSALALYFACFAASYKFCNKKFHLTKNYQKILIFAVLWIVFEMLRSVLFTGFPWNLLGYSLMFSDSLIQVASIFGIYGLSFFAILFCLTPTLFRKSSSDKIFAAIILLLFSANFIFGYFRINNTKLVTNDALKIRLVQGNIKQDLKWDPIEKYKNFSRHIELANEAEKSAIRAVIWSETAVPYVLDDHNQKLLQEIKRAIPDGGTLITGAIRTDYDSNYTLKNVWNSVFVLNQQGITQHYDKHHLVPFGEYVPLAKFLPFIEKITDGAIGFSEGEGPQTLQAEGFSFSPLVCYEVIFSDKIIDKNNRPDLLLNVTNDAWFGVSSGPFQHLDMAKMRAVEYGISLARVANTGITAFVDPFGRIVQKIALNKSGFIDVALIEKLDETIFSRLSYLPLILIFLVVSLFLITINFTTKNARIKKI